MFHVIICLGMNGCCWVRQWPPLNIGAGPSNWGPGAPDTVSVYYRPGHPGLGWGTLHTLHIMSWAGVMCNVHNTHHRLIVWRQVYNLFVQFVSCCLELLRAWHHKVDLSTNQGPWSNTSLGQSNTKSLGWIWFWHLCIHMIIHDNGLNY